LKNEAVEYFKKLFKPFQHGNQANFWG
jgi:hypothetical protein